MFGTWRPYESMKPNIKSFHMQLVHMHVLKHCSFRFIILLNIQRLSEHERFGAIGMLQAGVRVSDVT